MKTTKLLIMLLWGMSVSYALQGGPVQPDYLQFEPTDLQDMVNLSTGDFAYSLPLGEIPGPYGNYPLSIAYHAGITPQQEATWVGLGWSINPGVINRDVRGVPDDQFHGGTLAFVYQYVAVYSWAVNTGWSYGIISVGTTTTNHGGTGWSVTLGPKINNVAGVGFTVGTEECGLEASLGGKYGGVRAGVMLSNADGKGKLHGGAYGGANNVNISVDAAQGRKTSYSVGFSAKSGGDTRVGVRVGTNGMTASAGSISISKKGNSLGVQIGGVGGQIVSNASGKGNENTSEDGFMAIAPTPIGVFSFGFSQSLYEYTSKHGTSEYVYGYIYQAGPAIVADGNNSIEAMPNASAGNVQNSWSWTLLGRSLEKVGSRDLYPANDMYSVSAEGVSGSFQPMGTDAHVLNKKVSDLKTENTVGAQEYSFILRDSASYWQYDNEFEIVNNANIKSEYPSYSYCVTTDSCSVYSLYKTRFNNEGNRLIYRIKTGGPDTVRSRMNFLFVGEGGGYFESEEPGDGRNLLKNRISSHLLGRTIQNYEHALYGTKKIEPIFEDNDPVGKLQGFVITVPNGSKYYFKQPIKTYLKADYTINNEKGVPIFVDKTNDVDDGWWTNLLTGTKEWALWAIGNTPQKTIQDLGSIVFRKGELKEKCKESTDRADDVFYSYQVQMNPYATQWLLSEVQGADFVKLGDSIADNIGYQVMFHYSDPSVYYWRSPYSRPGLHFKDLPNFRQPKNGLTPDQCDSRMFQAAFGVKEYVYLTSIETATHRAVFQLNDPVKEERVDGKGWEVLRDTSSGVYGDIPIFVQSSVEFSVENGNWEEILPAYKHQFIRRRTYKPIAIYVNAALPQQLLRHVNAEKMTFSVGVLPTIKALITNDDFKDSTFIYRLNGSTDGSIILRLKANSKGVLFEKTSGDEARLGLYKLYVVTDSLITGYQVALGEHDNSSNGSTIRIVYGENGNYKHPLMLNWGNLIWGMKTDFANSNSMRYLKSINFYSKSDSVAYRKFKFGYDYSLQPKTLNSYCSERYPDTLMDVDYSPQRAPESVCDTAKGKVLYGKLTLKSIVEEGCRNGKCAALPPFQFSYLSPSSTPFRRSSISAYAATVRGSTDADSYDAYDSSYYGGMTDIDASILSSSNTMDDWGFWNQNATMENRKVSQEFADFGGAAWSLNKIKDPAGGIMEIEYERDRYRNGIDYSNEKKFVEIASFGQCSEFKGTGNGQYPVEANDLNKLCLEIGQLYWREQCLGPRVAFWDTLKPAGYKGSGFEYLDTLGLLEPNAPLFFNAKTNVSTNVDCGLFGVFSCSRTRSVALLGDGKYQKTYYASIPNGDKEKRLIVLDKDWALVKRGINIAARKIADQNWSIDERSSRMGFLWTSQSYEEMKGGDLRVKRLSLRDIGVSRQTEYLYAPGEIAQLPDSAFNVVLGGRFYASKVSYSMPEMNVVPKSRIVGLGDEDLMFVPGSKVTYPTVSVLNTNASGDTQNGKTEFQYVTPEAGVPIDYVDSISAKSFVPFLKLGVRLFNAFERAVHVNVQLLDSNQVVLGEMDVLLHGEMNNDFWFYSKKIHDVRMIRMVATGFNRGQTLESRIKLSNALLNYNEVFLACDVDEKKQTFDMREVWLRSQPANSYPILYKSVRYAKNTVVLDSLIDITKPIGFLNGFENAFIRESLSVDVEDSIVFHDLTAFLGQNYAIRKYRGNSEYTSIPVRVDSNVYSTMVPDVARGVVSNANADEVRQKTGKQIVKWQSNVSMDCKNEGRGESNRCKNDYLYLYEKSSKQSKKKFTHIRYPVFLVKSITYGGFDNNTRTSGFALMSKTQLENHQFDPLTGSPTVTVSSSPMANGKESRKINQNVPHYSLAKGGNFSDQLFLRNMLDQTYMDKTYAGVVDSSDDWNSLIGNNDSLRSVVLKPYRLLDIPELANAPKPLVAWGEFSLRKMGRYYTDDELWSYQNAANALPPLDRFNGNHIKVVDRFFKVREMQDQLGRTTLSLFSSDGMYQTGLYFPAEQKEVAQLVLNQGAISMDGCSVSGAYIVRPSEYSILATTATTIHCSVSTSKPLVVEYRLRRNGKWSTERNLLSTGTQADFSLSANDALGYVRLYPASARGRSFVYDQYGNLIQIVSEFNTSMYYEYDSFGQLSQIRDENGVSFKTHHREFMNDSLNELEIN